MRWKFCWHAVGLKVQLRIGQELGLCLGMDMLAGLLATYKLSRQWRHVLRPRANQSNQTKRAVASA